MLARLTSAKAPKTCTRYISNSSQIPWYTKGAGWRHLCAHYTYVFKLRPNRLFHWTARPDPTSEQPSMSSHTSGAARADTGNDSLQCRRLRDLAIDKVPHRSSSPYVCSHRLSLREEFVWRVASGGAWAPPGEACCTCNSASASQRSGYSIFLVPCGILVH